MGRRNGSRGCRRLVLDQRSVDVTVEPSNVTHLVDDLHGPIAIHVVQAIPAIRPRWRRLVGSIGVGNPRGVVGTLEVDHVVIQVSFGMTARGYEVPHT